MPPAQVVQNARGRTAQPRTLPIGSEHLFDSIYSMFVAAGLDAQRSRAGVSGSQCDHIQHTRLALCKNRIVAAVSWDPEQWQLHAIAMLQHHFGVEKVIPIPDQDGGDRGLDAYTVDGMAYQCYAPEDEPLAPSKRATLQKNKITTDLAKLKKFKDKLVPLLGDIKLHTWVLLTPVHQSAAVIEHCVSKAAEVIKWTLPFISIPFQVQVHSTTTYTKANRFITQTENFQSDLDRPPESPVGADFGAVEGALVDKMDAKLARIPLLKDAAIRREHRAVLLEGQLGGDNLLDRWRDRTPDVASHFESMIEAARKEMIFSAAGEGGPAQYYLGLRKSLVERFSSSVTTHGNAEFLAWKCITDWLQQCPLNFVEVP